MITSELFCEDQYIIACHDNILTMMSLNVFITRILILTDIIELVIIGIYIVYNKYSWLLKYIR